MSDMFGGMTTTGGGRRKKGKAGDIKDTDSTHSVSSTNLAELEKQQKDSQAQKDAALRAKLERFYGYYNPGKLESIDKTVDMFRGNEQKLWEMLATKYGPGPTDEQIAKQKAEREAKAEKEAKAAAGKSGGMQLRRRAQTTVSASEPAVAAAAPPATTENSGGGGGASGFGDNNSASGFGDDAGAAWGGGGGGGDDASTGAGGGFGFGGGDGTAGDAAAGWATGDTGSTGGGFGFGDSSDGATGTAGAGGFSFGEGGAAATGDGDAAGGFSFGGAAAAACAENADQGGGGGGFSFGGEPAAESSPGGGGFGFGSGDNQEEQQHQQQASNNNKACDDDSDDDSDDGVVEKIDKRVGKALSDVTARRDELSGVIKQLSDAVSQRRDALSECAQLEALVDDYTAKENFDKAEETHGRLLEAAKRVVACDESWQAGSLRLDPIAERVREAVTTGSRTFSEERTTLVQVRAEEERKMKSYITDATHKVDTAASRIKVDLDKAVRAQGHVEQDLADLHERKREIEGKIDEQTKGLRAEKDKIQTDAERLGSEIADLEKLLASKKRQLADKEANLEDVNHKLDLINRNHQEVMNSVLDSMKEEELNLRVCKSRVDDVTEQKRQNEEENASLQQEKKVMERDLEQHAGKIALLERQAQTLAAEVSIGFGSFFKKVVRAATEIRGKEGRFCLMMPYTVPGMEEEATTTTAGDDSSAASAAAAATSEAAAASTALQALKAQLSRLEQQLNLKTDEDSMLFRRLQDINRSIPSLEAAKKQAAAAKQFKEASAKTAELRSLNEEKDDIAAKSKALADDIKKIKKEIDSVEAQKLAEAKRFRASMRNFTDRYSATLRQASNAVEAADALALLGVGKMLEMPDGDSAEHSPKSVAAAQELDAAALRAAVKDLINVLFAELAAVCEVPESQLRAEPAPGKALSSAGVSPVSQGPAGMPSSSSLDQQQQSEGGKSPSPDRGGDDDQQEVHAAPAAMESEEADAAPAAASLTKEEIESRLEELNGKLEEAMGVEDYDLCEELQKQIDDLEAQK